MNIDQNKGINTLGFREEVNEESVESKDIEVGIQLTDVLITIQ